MAYKRNRGSLVPLTAENLTSAMVGIGMNFAARAASHPNIEDTILAASAVGMDQEDFRVLSVLMTWLDVHSARINVDRLTHLVLGHPDVKVRLFWSSVAVWLVKDRRFARLARVYQGPTVDLLGVGTAFHIHRSGEDPGSKEGRSGFLPESCVIVPPTCSPRCNWRACIRHTAGASCLGPPIVRICGRNWTEIRPCRRRNSRGGPADPLRRRGTSDRTGRFWRGRQPFRWRVRRVYSDPLCSR